MLLNPFPFFTYPPIPFVTHQKLDLLELKSEPSHKLFIVISLCQSLAFEGNYFMETTLRSKVNKVYTQVKTIRNSEVKKQDCVVCWFAFIIKSDT